MWFFFNGILVCRDVPTGGRRRSDCYIEDRMKKPDIARRMARQAGVSQGEAADRLDRVVHEILSSLRKGREAPLPGLGKFTQGPNGEVTFEREGGKLRD